MPERVKRGYGVLVYRCIGASVATLLDELEHSEAGCHVGVQSLVHWYIGVLVYPRIGVSDYISVSVYKCSGVSVVRCIGVVIGP